MSPCGPAKNGDVVGQDYDVGGLVDEEELVFVRDVIRVLEGCHAKDDLRNNDTDAGRDGEPGEDIDDAGGVTGATSDGRRSKDVCPVVLTSCRRIFGSELSEGQDTAANDEGRDNAAIDNCHWTT